jgi:hypothetical protein
LPHEMLPLTMYSLRSAMVTAGRTGEQHILVPLHLANKRACALGNRQRAATGPFLS